MCVFLFKKTGIFLTFLRKKTQHLAVLWQFDLVTSCNKTGSQKLNYKFMMLTTMCMIGVLITFIDCTVIRSAALCTLSKSVSWKCPVFKLNSSFSFLFSVSSNNTYRFRYSCVIHTGWRAN